MGGQSSTERCRPPKLDGETGHWVACSSPLNAAYSEDHLASLVTERDQKLEKRYRELYESAIRASRGRTQREVNEFELRSQTLLEKREKTVSYGLSEKLRTSAEANHHTLSVWEAQTSRLIADVAIPGNVPVKTLAILGKPTSTHEAALMELEKLNQIVKPESEQFPLGISVMYQEDTDSLGLYLWNLANDLRKPVKLYPSIMESQTHTPRVQWMVSLPHARIVLVCASVPVDDFLRLRDIWLTGKFHDDHKDNGKSQLAEELAIPERKVDPDDEECLRVAARSLFQYIHPIFVVSTISAQVIGFHAIDAPAHAIAGRFLYTAGSAGTWGALRQFDVAQLQPNAAGSGVISWLPQVSLTGPCISPMTMVKELEMRELHNVTQLLAYPADNMLFACCRRGLSNDFPDHRYSGIVAMRLDLLEESAKQPIGPSVRTLTDDSQQLQVAMKQIATARAAVVNSSSDNESVGTVRHANAVHAAAVERTVPSILLPLAWLSEDGASESLTVVPVRTGGQQTVLAPYFDERQDLANYSLLVLASCTSTSGRSPEDIIATPANTFLPITSTPKSNTTSTRPKSQLADTRERSLGLRLGGHESSFTGLDAHTRGWLIALAKTGSKGPVAESKFWGRVLFSGQVTQLPGSGMIAIKSFDSREPWVRFLDNRVRHTATWTPFALRGVGVLQLVGCEPKSSPVPENQKDSPNDANQVNSWMTSVLLSGFNLALFESAVHNRTRGK